MSPEFVKRCSRSLPTERVPSPYMTGMAALKMPRSEYAISSTHVVWRLDARNSFSRMLSRPNLRTAICSGKTRDDVRDGNWRLFMVPHCQPKVGLPVLRVELNPLSSQVFLQRPYTGIPDAIPGTTRFLRLQRDAEEIYEREG